MGIHQHNRSVLCYVFWLILLGSQVYGSVKVPGLTYSAYAREGDANVGVLLRVHGNCNPMSPVSASAIQTVEGIIHFLDKINNDTSILPNITLGVVFQDTCGYHLGALARSVYFAPEAKDDTCTNTYTYDGQGPQCCNQSVTEESQYKTKYHYSVIGVVGPATSRESVLVANFLGLFHIPMLGTYASSDELSDKSRFEYFSRLVPPDRFTSFGIAAILERFNWTYVSVIYSEGPFGENGAKQVHKVFRTKDICVAYSAMIPGNAEEPEVQDIARKLGKFINARVVILFADQHMTPFFKEIIKQKWQDHFIFIGQYSTPSEHKEALTGSLFFSYPSSHFDSDFKEKFLSMNSSNQNPWFKEYWQDKFQCQWENLTMSDHCHNYSTVDSDNPPTFSTFYPRYVDGVKSFALALHSHLQNSCPQVFTNKDELSACLKVPGLLAQLRNVSFDGASGHISFNKYGDLYGQLIVRQFNREGKLNHVGTWDQQTKELHIESINWQLATSQRDDEGAEIPESVCAKLCHPKQYYHVQELPCCWECKFCRDNEVIVNDSSCHPCPLYTWPEETEALFCLYIEPWVLTWSHPAFVALTCLAIVGALASAGMVIFYVMKKKVKLIKASSFGLSMLILTGIAMAYILIFSLLSVPSEITCFINRFGLNLTVTVMYGPLLVKTNRIYRIFSGSKHGNQRPPLISSKSQAMFSIILILGQVVLSTILLIVYPTNAGPSQPVPTDKLVELVCSVPLEGVLVPFIFNAVIICVCAVYGFLTRSLPENFNESWYLFIAVATTMFLWLAFLPIYFTAFYALHQTLLMCCVMFLSATIILCCLYIPKVYAVYCVDENHLKMLNPSMLSSVSPMAEPSTLTVPVPSFSLSQPQPRERLSVINDR